MLKEGKTVKKLLTLAVVMLGVLSGCNSTDSNGHNTTLSQKMLRPVIAHECQSELTKSKVWKASSLFLAAETQNQIKDQACTCVSQHALDDVATSQILKATVSETAKKELVRQAVVNSLSGCLQDTLQTL